MLLLLVALHHDITVASAVDLLQSTDCCFLDLKGNISCSIWPNTIHSIYYPISLQNNQIQYGLFNPVVYVLIQSYCYIHVIFMLNVYLVISVISFHHLSGKIVSVEYSMEENLNETGS